MSSKMSVRVKQTFYGSVSTCASGALAPSRPALSDAADQEFPAWRRVAEGLRGTRDQDCAGHDRDQQSGLQGPARLRLRRLVQCRLPPLQTPHSPVWTRLANTAP